MKKVGKILSFLLAIIMCFGMFGGITVYADEVSDSKVETTGEAESDLEGYCLVTVTLKDFKTDETDNIILEFKSKKSGERKQTTLKKSESWAGTVYLEPGKHTISFVSADENREIELHEEVLEVADAKSAAVSLNVKKVLNNNFFPKFFRNNTFTLILLAISSTAYFILKKRRESLGR